MLSSGLTLVKALDILAREQPSESAKIVWQDIYENVQKGESFSSALELHSGTFPQFLISMINAGEPADRSILLCSECLIIMQKRIR